MSETITLERFKISVHEEGYYAVSIPEYYGGQFSMEVIECDKCDLCEDHHG